MIVSIVTILVGLATLPRTIGISLPANYQRIRCLFDRGNLRLILGFVAWTIRSEQGDGVPLGEVTFCTLRMVGSGTIPDGVGHFTRGGSGKEPEGVWHYTLQ